MPPSAHKKDPPPHRHPPTQLGHSRAVAQPRCRLVGDVHGVSVDRRHADRCEVVREVSSRVELAVLGGWCRRGRVSCPRRAWRGSGGGGSRRRLCPRSTLLRAARPGGKYFAISSERKSVCVALVVGAGRRCTVCTYLPVVLRCNRSSLCKVGPVLGQPTPCCCWATTRLWPSCVGGCRCGGGSFFVFFVIFAKVVY